MFKGPNGKPIGLSESEMKKDRGLAVLVGVGRCFSITAKRQAL
jgi:hypothetical protein